MHREQSLRTALGEIETLRMKRQRQYADRSHPSLKRFTQQELNDEACPTYKNLLVGRSLRLPDRQTMLRIADYLECNSDERNDLLAAAGYLPILSLTTGRSLELALEHAHRLMENVTHPAMLITQTLDIQTVNGPFSRLFGISRDYVQDNRFTLFDFHFDAELPVRPRSTFDAASFAQWESHAIAGIRAFKRNHMLSRHDAWYLELVRKFQGYDDASKYWNMEAKQPETGGPPAKIVLARTSSAGEFVPIRTKQIFLSAGSGMYPRVAVFLPVDEPARRAFEYAGSPAGCSGP
ncbi:hypothetical protein [Paenibacillus glycinis]|uniref:MmyB-like transcription regulator ligand binding domain-containing protein n=1 Tax=Paenibacillus glycinis TaxID=2697035 RepID=A0ABW9Y160_9BACL|nr:hypothetical protein [Paenibacillus glycinis]NBD28137.1 hypothetical protein [Paenibacillus glycinis]